MKTAFGAITGFVDMELASQRLPESFCVPNLLYRSCYAIYKNSDKLNTSVRAAHTSTLDSFTKMLEHLSA